LDEGFVLLIILGRFKNERKNQKTFFQI